MTFTLESDYKVISISNKTLVANIASFCKDNDLSVQYVNKETKHDGVRMTDLLALFDKDNAGNRLKLINIIEDYVKPAYATDWQDHLRYVWKQKDCKVTEAHPEGKKDIIKMLPEDCIISMEIVADIFLNQRQNVTNRKGETSEQKAFFDLQYYSNRTVNKELKEANAERLVNDFMAIWAAYTDGNDYDLIHYTVGEMMADKNTNLLASVERVSAPVVNDDVCEGEPIIVAETETIAEDDAEEEPTVAEMEQVEEPKAEENVAQIVAKAHCLLANIVKDKSLVKKHAKQANITAMLMEFTSTKALVEQHPTVDFNTIGINERYLEKYNKLAKAV